MEIRSCLIMSKKRKEGMKEGMKRQREGERMKEEAVKKNELNEHYLNALLKNFSCEKHPLASIITEGIDAIKSRIYLYYYILQYQYY